MRKRVVLSWLIGFIGIGLWTYAETEADPSKLNPEIDRWLGVSDAVLINHKLSEYDWKPYREGRDMFLVPYVAYAQDIPSELALDLKYDEYPIGRHFGVALNEGVYIRQTPKLDSKILSKRGVHAKLDVLGIVHGEHLAKWKTDLWYKVSYGEKGAQNIGYVFSGYLEKREFQYAKMLESAQTLGATLSGKVSGHIDNYKNRNGKPPKWNNTEVDAYGFKRDQSAPGYSKPDVTSSFRYLSDGRLLVVQEDLGEFLACTHPLFEGVYYIPKKYVALHEASKTYSKFIVVDRKNQTEAAFELKPEGWTLVSQNLVTTGAKAEFKEETELGYFQVIEKREKFIYLDDVTKEVDGYAPYALRFNGGAYTHGVPVNFKKILEKVLVAPEVKDASGIVVKAATYEEKVKELLDPGLVEYLSTIGTIPRSHKCVRHHTSNALFLYSWATIGETSVIVLD